MQYEDDVARAADEARDWLFNEYVPSWVATATDPSVERRSVLDYWTPPLHISADGPSPPRATHGWYPDADAVIAYLAVHQAPLKAAGYTRTEVPDSRVTACTARAAGIDAIWSRRAVDGAEIERLAVHFEVRRDDAGTWHMIAVVGRPTEALRIADAWVAQSA